MYEELKSGKGLKRISYLRSAGNNWAEITRTINSEYHFNISANNLKNIYDVFIVKRREIVEGDEQLKGELKQAVLDWRDQLKRANDLVWEVIHELRAKKQPEKVLQALDRLHSQLYLQNKILNEMNKSVSVTQFNTINIVQAIKTHLPELEKQGFIKILDLPEHWKGEGKIIVRSDKEGGWK